jgi:WhiB family redox-sensing transcriptional regulator
MTDLRRLPRATVEHWAWQLDASCRGMDVGHFYHPAAERNKAREQRIAQARAICQQCPVIAECLDHALRVREPYGIWGGRSEDERAALLGVKSLRYPARIIEIGQPKDKEPGERARVRSAQYSEPSSTAAHGEPVDQSGWQPPGLDYGAERQHVLKP